MKTKSTPLYILKLALTLLIITAVVAAALGGVNSITAPIIEKINYEKTQAAIEAVLPGGGEALESFTDDTGFVRKVYASESGYAIEVATPGFGGDVVMMVGVIDGKVNGISVIKHAETAGLGAVAAAKTSAGEAFRNQFIGLSGQLAVSKDGGVVDSITSATITSRAITNGVNAALKCAENLG